MKKWISYLGIMFCMIVSATIFSACDFSVGSGNTNPTADPPKAVVVPTDIEVSGYSKEITVGDDFIDKLKVKIYIDGKWQELAKADYRYSTTYDGSKYGQYSFNVYLKEYPNIDFSDTITVTPIKVAIPSEYSTTYNGDEVDIKSHYEAQSNGLYSVYSYVNMTNCGDYEVQLKLNNSDKYVWSDESGEILTNPVQKIDWHITKAGRKQYTGAVDFVAYLGDTLQDLMYDNNLKNITWYMDGNGNNISGSTAIAKGVSYYAYYNENPLNYEDTLITITISDIITTSNYKVEYYVFDGETYNLDEEKTVTNSATIGTDVEADVPSGYQLDKSSSELKGKVVKKDGLVLKVYIIPNES